MVDYDFEPNPISGMLDLVPWTGWTTTPPSVTLSSPQAWDYEVWDIVNVILNATFVKWTNNIVSLDYRKNMVNMATHLVWPAGWTDNYTDVWLTSNVVWSTFSYTARVVDDTALSGVSNTVLVRFVSLFYRGSNPATTINDVQIEALANVNMQNQFVWVYPFWLALWNYKYFAYPASFWNIADPTSDIKDVWTWFPVPFQKQLWTVNVTNSFWVVLPYNVYRSVNILGGIQNLRIV